MWIRLLGRIQMSLGQEKKRTLPVSYSLPGEWQYYYVIIVVHFLNFLDLYLYFGAKIYVFPSFVCRAETLLPYWFKICKYFWTSMFFIAEFQFSYVVVKSPFFVYMTGNWKKQINSQLRHKNNCMILMSQLTELQFPNMQNRILSTAHLRFK